MTDVASKFGLGSGGLHFKDPWLLTPMTAVATNIKQIDSVGVENTAATVAFFTGIASQGVLDSTNWTAGTYKTIYSHTGSGVVAGMVACTAGGAETTTFEVTVDGALSTITITNANTERAFLLAGGIGDLVDFTTANIWTYMRTALDAGTLTTFQNPSAATELPPLRWLQTFGTPLLRYNSSMLIRMKHSVNITNSTATAYSGVWVRKGIAA